MPDLRGLAVACALLGAPAGAHAQATAHAAPPPAPSPIDELRARGLEFPVEGVSTTDLRDNFSAARGRGRKHQALDILAPRGTPVVAVEDGTIRRLSLANGGGGVVVYQADPDDRYVYYYAHLERWAEGLAEGDAVTRGQVIGYVGTSGNAPPDTPHLHFAIYRLEPGSRGWHGSPLNPYEVLL
ncbi:MAG TPA: M23 family metallopeptidase [Gemmatimonadota bacterium]|nr:M23 family metallopeptidase [Gemmatimonadota bacterium]